MRRPRSVDSFEGFELGNLWGLSGVISPYSRIMLIDRRHLVSQYALLRQ